MELEPHDALNVLVIWRGKHVNVKVNPNSKVLEFGEMLRKLTNVQSDTLRLLVPQSKNQSARLVSPFSAEHSNLSLQEASVLEGKPIRMMGAFDDEVKEVSQSSIKSDSRILGFDEEEKRLKQRMWNSQQASLKLPTGNYIFCDFRTLNLPGIELNPPPSEALRRMHMLACDPGIIAIMNKHRWRVGIMTEMAPEGYVGISPKCILGFNKNHGEEISLRLRTDDLKGFRKYESIKRTLLHELAHMVYSDHDANFHALDKQLNQESASLDWTKSRGHTLSGRKISDYYDEEELHLGGSSSSTGRKLGGATNSLATARVSSVAAAYNRILNSSSEGPNPSNNGHLSDAAVEPDPDEFELNGVDQKITAEPDPDEFELNGDDQNITAEPEPDESGLNGVDQKITAEPDPDEFGLNGVDQKITAEPDPDDDTVMIENYAGPSIEPSANDSELMSVDTSNRSVVEPDPDEYISSQTTTIKNFIEPDPDESSTIIPSSNISVADEVMIAKPDTDYQRDGLSSELLQRIEEPVAALCSRIQRAIVMLKAEATPMEANSALQMLFKIIRNVIEHPEDMKFRKLRKSNPHIQRNVANYKAAMEFLTTIGFSEDDISDEVGRKETYLVLKRNDPGLLWLAKSSLEVSMA